MPNPWESINLNDYENHMKLKRHLYQYFAIFRGST